MTTSRAALPSRLGTASLCVAIGVPAVLAVLLALLWISNASRASHDARFFLGGAVALYFFGFAPTAHLAGLLFGVVSLFRRKPKRWVGVLGMLLNLALVVAGVVIFALFETVPHLYIGPR
jgi:hypothetical protein